MTLRTFLMLLIATAIGVAAAAAAVMTRPGDEAYANLGDPVVPGLIDRVNEVAKIRIESQEGGVLTFQRQASGKGWAVVERDLYPAKGELAKSLALKVAQLTYLAPKTRNPERYSRLELGDPTKPGTQSTGVRLMDKDGKEMANLIIGRARAVIEGSSQGGAYFRIPGQAQTWVGKGNMAVEKLIFDWIERDLIDIMTKRVKRVTITHPDGEKIDVFKDQPGDANFILADLPGDKKIKDALTINGVASTIGDFQVQDVKKRGTHAVDPKKSVRIVYETFDGLTITALLEKQTATKDGKAVDSYWVDLSVQAGPLLKDADKSALDERAKEVEVLRARTENWVYEISDYRFNALAKRLEDLIGPAGRS